MQGAENRHEQSVLEAGCPVADHDATAPMTPPPFCHADSKNKEVKPPGVSVVVPIYNVEKYLRQCLDSIVGQTLQDIEIILVNDGSTDGSLSIIHEYAQQDNRITVIDKPNEGYGKTMNRGIEAATGEYIGIVESDDWIEPDMYETLYRIAKSHDVEVVKANYVAFDDKTGKDIREAKMPNRDLEQVINSRQNPGIFFMVTSIWSAIYRRDFLHKYDIRFLESPGASFQDMSFNFKIWAMAQRAYLTMKPLVHYRKHPDQSIADKDKVFCACDEYGEIERYMNAHPVLFKKLEKIFIRTKYCTYLWNFKRLSGANREMFRKRMQEELIPILQNKTIDLTGLNSRDKSKLLSILYPKSIGQKIRHVWENGTRYLFTRKQRNGFMETQILFGLIVIERKALVEQGAGSIPETAGKDPVQTDCIQNVEQPRNTRRRIA